MIKLSEKIKHQREAVNLTQVELAERSNLSRSTIQRMEEEDNHNWQLKSVLKICRYFKWNVEALVERDNTIFFDEGVRLLSETDIAKSFQFGFDEGYQQGVEDTKLRFDYKDGSKESIETDKVDNDTDTVENNTEKKTIFIDGDYIGEFEEWRKK